MSKKNKLTKSNVAGVASAPYDTAIFTCTVQSTGPTGPKAKEAARPAIDALNATLDALEAKGVEIDRAGLRAEPEVQPASEYDQDTRRNVRRGYSASYTLTFQTCSVERASEVHDALTEIEDVAAAAPTFKIKNLTKLHSRALRDAKRKRDARFKDECKAFGLDPDDYVVDTYQPTYEERESAGAQPYAMRALAAESVGGGRTPVQVKAGLATVIVRLSCTYRLRGVGFSVGSTKSAGGAGPERSSSPTTEKSAGGAGPTRSSAAPSAPAKNGS